ncbi:unnamed protein product, partial [Sphagnum tenellum]
EYKDNVDNAKELFKFALVDEATRSFRPPEPDAMRNVPLDDDDIHKLDEINKSKVCSGNWIYVSEVVDVSQGWRKNGVHHRLAQRIAAQHLGAPDSNGLQERVFSVCPDLDIK